jgi:hypothetical protein
MAADIAGATESYWVYATATFKYVADGLGTVPCLVWRSDMIVSITQVFGVHVVNSTDPITTRTRLVEQYENCEMHGRAARRTREPGRTVVTDGRSIACRKDADTRVMFTIELHCTYRYWFQVECVHCSSESRQQKQWVAVLLVNLLGATTWPQHQIIILPGIVTYKLQRLHDI